MSDNRDLLNDKDVCSFEEHEAENVCSNKDAVPCRVYSVYTKNRRQKRLSISCLNIRDRFKFCVNAWRNLSSFYFAR